VFEGEIVGGKKMDEVEKKCMIQGFNWRCTAESRVAVLVGE